MRNEMSGRRPMLPRSRSATLFRAWSLVLWSGAALLGSLLLLRFGMRALGVRLSDISHAIQTVTEEHGFSVVRSLVGHGVGRSMHEEPQIPNYGEPGRGPRLSPGMTFAIEPMITAGSPEVILHDDEWSISTADGSLAAHFEHTVAITEAEPRILTAARTPVHT